MHRKSLDTFGCPIARTLDQVGEWWSILILRDAFLGARRFDEFQRNLEVATNILTRRLKTLVEHRLLEKRPYQARPVRHEYVLTDKGRDFLPVVLSLLAWGNRWLAPEGATVELTDRVSDTPVNPVVVDSRTGQQLTLENVRLSAGPAAGEAVLQWLIHRRND